MTVVNLHRLIHRNVFLEFIDFHRHIAAQYLKCQQSTTNGEAQWLPPIWIRDTVQYIGLIHGQEQVQPHSRTCHFILWTWYF